MLSPLRPGRSGKRFSASNPFFAALGMVGVLTFTQGMVLRPPETSAPGAIPPTLADGSDSAFSGLAQPIGTAAENTAAAIAIEAPPLTATLAGVAPESAPTAAPNLSRYVVRAGDTVDAIAAQHGISASTIAWVNNLSNPNLIRPGQVLQITSVDSARSAVAAAAPVRAIGTPSEQAFISGIARPAQDSQRVTGIPASVTIAQAILETYWGTSFLARDANNYFGIKAHRRGGTDGVVWIDAWEVENGKNVVRQEPFRKYSSVTDSLVDHGRFFHENSRYAHALEARADAREFARRINTAGYATDPAYSSKLIALMERFALFDYDAV